MSDTAKIYKAARDNANNEVYTKVILGPEGFIVSKNTAISGALRAWSKDPDYVYNPLYRVAGNSAHVMAYLASSLDSASNPMVAEVVNRSMANAFTSQSYSSTQIQNYETVVERVNEFGLPAIVRLSDASRSYVQNLKKEIDGYRMKQQLKKSEKRIYTLASLTVIADALTKGTYTTGKTGSRASAATPGSVRRASSPKKSAREKLTEKLAAAIVAKKVVDMSKFGLKKEWTGISTKSRTKNAVDIPGFLGAVYNPKTGRPGAKNFLKTYGGLSDSAAESALATGTAASPQQFTAPGSPTQAAAPIFAQPPVGAPPIVAFPPASEPVSFGQSSAGAPPSLGGGSQFNPPIGELSVGSGSGSLGGIPGL